MKKIILTMQFVVEVGDEFAYDDIEIIKRCAYAGYADLGDTPDDYKVQMFYEIDRRLHNPSEVTVIVV